MQIALPEGPFDCILADPPWAYRCNRPPLAELRPCHHRGEYPQSVDHYYDTMPAEQIRDLPVKDIAAGDSALFLWATNPLLPEALSVLRAWGFRYKTILTWEKENGKGMGYWFRGVTEHVLFGVRGNLKAFRSPAKSLIRNRVGPHSAKPDRLYDIIEAAMPGARKLEMFARRAREGWTSWGNEVERDLFTRDETLALVGEGEVLALVK